MWKGLVPEVDSVDDESDDESLRTGLDGCFPNNRVGHLTDGNRRYS